MKLLLLAFFPLLAARTDASASQFGYEWSASGCMPGDPAIQGDLFTDVSGDVKHGSGSLPSSGLVTLYCPVTREFMYAPNYLQLTYSDNNTSSAASVSAGLIKMDKTTGAITGVAATSSENNDCEVSPGGNCEDGATHVEYAGIPTGWYNPSAYIYYIRVDIAWASSSDNEVFKAVQLIAR